MSYAVDLTIGKKTPLTSQAKKDAKDKLDAEYKEQSRLVKGIFKNLEAPGATLAFPYRAYPHDEIRMYTLEDGKTYEIPICVAKHINNNCNEKAHVYLRNLDGDMIRDPKVIPARQRYQFQSTEFI
jgi:hypothetical protein